ncbi:MAG: type IV toxin-antitoxin system AbiEi family antitoxin domain-containing protein [Candidatus Berkiella sp.]
MGRIEQEAMETIQKLGGIIRTSEAIKQGIHCRTLYALRDSGLITQISRGVYRLAALEPISNPDLVTIATRAPQAVVCLISALAFHNITTQIPHIVSIAISRDATPPRIEVPPISVHRFSGEAFKAGIEEHMIDGVPVKIYSVEKTLADCFKYRNKIGLDVCIEALKLYKARKKINVHEIIKYAKICRVYNVVTPHLESIL